MAKKHKQFSLFKDTKRSDVFGGALLKGNPKRARPLDSKLPIHLVLTADKSQLRAPKTFGKINATVFETCKRHGVRLYKYANVGNHLHLLIKIRNRRAWAAFIRELTGRVAQVAQAIAGQQKGAARFWKSRPFTRIVRGWRQAFRKVKEYIHLNILESEGFIKRSEVPSVKDLYGLLGLTT